MPKKFPKISIITPSFNQGKYIEKTIQSVLGQDYPNLEYFVIDGGSTDETLEILKKYNKQIKWISEKDHGQTDAINKGMRLTTGEIVGYLNSDDLLENNCLAKIVKFFVSNPEISWVTGKCHIINAKGDKSRSFVTEYKNIYLKYMRFINTLYVLNYIPQPATFWRRGVVHNIGLLDDFYHLSMDYDYWLRIFKKYKLGYIDDYLAFFRVHETSKGNRMLNDQLQESYQISKKYTSRELFLIPHKLHDIISSYLYRGLYLKNEK